MAAEKPADTYEEVFEDEEAPKEAQSMHRIRANSSIMQLKKILGECLLKGRREVGQAIVYPLSGRRQLNGYLL